MTTAIRRIQWRGDLWEHAFAYFWLLFAAITTLPASPRAGWVVAVSLVLTAALAVWYWFWQVAELGSRFSSRNRGYLVGALGAPVAQ